jgi:hypothetical protein
MYNAFDRSRWAGKGRKRAAGAEEIRGCRIGFKRRVVELSRSILDTR